MSVPRTSLSYREAGVLSPHARLHKIVTQNQSEDTTVSWPATRLLGHLTERHFLAVVEALEQREAGCDELAALLTELDGEQGTAVA